MPHPSLGLPPADVTRGLPAAAARLRGNRERLARLSLENAVRLAPRLNERYDEVALRRLLRDCERHLEQLARALETGEDHYVINYGEWLVPIYRRRKVPMKDFIALLDGLRHAAASVLTPEEMEIAEPLFGRWVDRLRHHQRLPGDHRGNPIVRFFWKGAGVLDDEVI
ncbi:MAG: hypothetical protein M3253_07390 [Chloroflexota bacterium]|nr:hypothetical protein [Chloroflexota bacterium]